MTTLSEGAVVMPVVAVVPRSPGSPAMAVAKTRLVAAPVSPEVESARTLAPVAAKLSASPRAAASPVRPERPLSPESALPPVATAVPRMASLTAEGDESASPVSPVAPELPDVACGEEIAVEAARPVLPVFVALP
jgi:hypothetical protein